jgi:hypothetical protein
MTQFRGAGCQCAPVAVMHRKIHNYRQAGRLTQRKPRGLGPPRADRSPVEPHCIRHLLQFSEERLGKSSGLGSRQTDFGGHGTPAGVRDRLRGPRWRPSCADPKRLQQISDALTEDKIDDLPPSGCVYFRIAAPVTTAILNIPNRILLDSGAKVACIYGLPQGSVAS